MARPSALAAPTVPGGLDFSGLVSHTELAEGGGFGPSSFRGYPIAAGYCPHRYTPKDGFKEGANASYFLALYLRFHVDEVLDTDSGWDADANDNEFDYHFKLGSKSLQYLYASNDTHTPAGISGGFDELSLMAQGRLDNGAVVTFDDPVEPTRGRWFFPRPGTPEGKGKLEGKSGYALMLRESVPAIEAVDPSLILSWENKKGETEKTLNVWAPAADGNPAGALFFIGLSGTWDTKKLQLDIKGEKAEQRALYLTQFDGRVEVPEMGEVQTPVAQSPATGKKRAPAPAQAAAAPASAGAADLDLDTALDSDSKIRQLILGALPVSGAAKLADLAKAVGPQLTKTFKAAELPAIVGQFNKIIKEEAPDKDGAQALADMGMPPLFTYDKSNQTVERWTTA